MNLRELTKRSTTIKHHMTLSAEQLRQLFQSKGFPVNDSTQMRFDGEHLTVETLVIQEPE